MRYVRKEVSDGLVRYAVQREDQHTGYGRDQKGYNIARSTSARRDGWIVCCSPTRKLVRVSGGRYHMRISCHRRRSGQEWLQKSQLPMPQSVASGSLASTTPKHRSLQRARVASEDDIEGECFDMRSSHLAGLQPSFNRSLQKHADKGATPGGTIDNPNTLTSHKKGCGEVGTHPKQGRL